MIDGDWSFMGCDVLTSLIIWADFFTLVFYFAQDDEIVVPLLDVCQSLFSWPSVHEGIILTTFIWALRHIERLFAFHYFVIFLIYNFLTFLPIYILIIAMNGFHSHFSLFYFVPFSMFIYSLWEIPASKVFSFITDKFILCFAILTIIISHFPFPSYCLPAAILGNVCWFYDILKLKTFIYVPMPEPINYPMELPDSPDSPEPEDMLIN